MSGDNDIPAKVLGLEHGRLRAGGVGVSATNTRGPCNMSEDLQRENRYLKDELEIVRAQVEANERKVDELQSIIGELIKRFPTPNGHSQVLLSNSLCLVNSLSILV